MSSATKVVVCEDPDCESGPDGDPVVLGDGAGVRCLGCGLVVCSWCFSHVHVLSHTDAAEVDAAEVDEKEIGST